jgi:hypothetical protein
MSLTGELERPDVAIFADTQFEPEAVYRHLQWLENFAARHRFQILRVTAGNLRADVIHSKEKGRVANPPFFALHAGGRRGGMLLRACTSDYKIRPIKRKLRELIGSPRGNPAPATVEQWFGISTDEAIRMRQSSWQWITFRYPLIEKRMSRADCLAWLKARGFPLPPKSACIGCPYHSDEYWRQMKEQRPREWADAVAFDRAIREGLPGVKKTLFVHRSLKPLDAVDFSAPEAEAQLNLFGNECAGVCGV